MVDRRIINGKMFELQVAKPIPDLIHEFIELINEIFAGIIFFTILVVAVSFYLADNSEYRPWHS